jgi:hypothetical protein
MFKVETLVRVSFWRALEFQPFSWRTGSNPRCQSKDILMNYKTCINACMKTNTMWRIKSQPSNPTSCSDNALRLLVLETCILYWGFQVMSSFSIWGCILKGYFERGILWRAKLRSKGIEDLNLEWTIGAYVTTMVKGQSWVVSLRLHIWTNLLVNFSRLLSSLLTCWAGMGISSSLHPRSCVHKRRVMMEPLKWNERGMFRFHHPTCWSHGGGEGGFQGFC